MDFLRRLFGKKPKPDFVYNPTLTTKPTVPSATIPLHPKPTHMFRCTVCNEIAYCEWFICCKCCVEAGNHDH